MTDLFTINPLDRALERAEQAARSFGLADGDLAPPPAVIRLLRNWSTMSLRLNRLV